MPSRTREQALGFNSKTGPSFYWKPFSLGGSVLVIAEQAAETYLPVVLHLIRLPLAACMA